ncbi:MAG: hypothetical protein DHS20C05_22370 [Hyphococcus sp.]|nr:MAG: hypothetical protein DHS20C05_22370 [Marinicaulis sp.]
MTRNLPKTLADLTSSFWFWALAITAFRFLILIMSDANLGPDEAQYWYWSRDFDFGYFSKPPMIAWAIGFTTSIFGNEEWAVRLAAPVFHLGTATFLYATAKQHFSLQVAFWAGLGWLTIPGVILSSFIITTDTPLLFFWAGGLFFLFRLIAADKPSPINFIGLGTMIGLGFMSKYAMLYFIASLVLTSAFSPSVRRALLQPHLLMTAALAIAIATPNILWNAANDFQTVAHTAANANWSSSLFKPLSFLSFFSAQPAVVGIIPFFTLLFAAISWRKISLPQDNMPKAEITGRNWKIITLLVFSLTPLLIVSTQSLISRAHANWAATAYPATILLITALLFQIHKGWLAKASIALHSFFILLFAAGVTNFALVDRVGLSDAMAQLRGWKSLSADIASKSNGYDAIVIDDRSLIGTMLYYQRDLPLDIVTIDSNLKVDNHYEAFLAFDPTRHKHVLFATTRSDSAHVDFRFDTVIPVAPSITSLGRTSDGPLNRAYHLYDITGYNGQGTIPQ